MNLEILMFTIVMVLVYSIVDILMLEFLLESVMEASNLLIIIVLVIVAE